MNYESDESFLKFWASVRDKKDSIDKQLDESQKKMTIQMVENQRQIEESEKKFLNLWEEIVTLIRGKA